MTAIVTSCQKKNNAVAEASANEEVRQDSIRADSMKEDSLEQAVPVPKAADEYFNDFIYSFTTNVRYQFNRIAFPLPCRRNKDSLFLKKSQWKFTRLHTKNAVYTVFFDNKSSLALEKERDVSNVKIEFFKMPKRSVRRYVFKKVQERWMLTRIEDFPLHEYTDYKFIEFYQRFASDTVYQMEHIKPVLSIKVVDPEDEFEKLEGVIDAEQWTAFRPELPANVFTNIDYGQTLKFRHRRVVAIEGSSNGFLCLLYFVKEKGQWLLYKFEN